VTDYLAAIKEAEALFKHDHEDTTDPKELDARAMRFVAKRRGYDLAFGPLAVRVVDERIWATAGYPSLEDYCLERLGMAPSGFRQRVWLERQMFALPPLREALESGRLSYTKALLVAADATPDTVAELIARAAETTWQQTDREVTAREDRKNRAKGIRRLWAPEDVMETIVAAIRSAQNLAVSQGKRIDTGEALAVVADHFLEVWSKHRRKPHSEARAKILRRNRGCCQVPGCSLPARHVHHLRPRSRGGTDDPWNETQLCIPHHLRGIHDGHLTVEGRGGERLEWHFGNGEIWITEGDDARRMDAAPAAEPPNPAADRLSEPTAPPYGPEPLAPDRYDLRVAAAA
jgi:hypothetical protein